MASRLTRWGAVTLVTIVVAIATLLPPGVSRIVEWGGNTPTYPTNALDAAVAANFNALAGAQFDLRKARWQREFDHAIASGRSPIVLDWSSDHVEFQPAFTTAAESLWRAIPQVPDAPRTVLLLKGDWRTWAPRTPPGVCVGILNTNRGAHWVRSVLRHGAGGCYLATEFGPAGRGLDRWLRAYGSLYVPGEIPPVPVVEQERPASIVPWADGWSRRGGFDWWSGPTYDACIAGQGWACVEAYGFGPAPDPARNIRLDSYVQWNTGLGQIPAALYADLGPERFRELWRSDDPVPETYQRLTGRPFSAWILDFAQRRAGRFAKDNALSWLGWLGTAGWIALLLGWFTARMVRQPAQ